MIVIDRHQLRERQIGALGQVGDGQGQGGGGTRLRRRSGAAVFSRSRSGAVREYLSTRPQHRRPPPARPDRRVAMQAMPRLRLSARIQIAGMLTRKRAGNATSGHAAKTSHRIEVIGVFHHESKKSRPRLRQGTDASRSNSSVPSRSESEVSARDGGSRSASGHQCRPCRNIHAARPADTRWSDRGSMSGLPRSSKNSYESQGILGSFPEALQYRDAGNVDQTRQPRPRR